MATALVAIAFSLPWVALKAMPVAAGALPAEEALAPFVDVVYAVIVERQGR